jgi:UDPglucose 6-dehydrogenase
MTPTLAVVGLWHLGCTIAAAWTRLGYGVRAVDPSAEVVRGLEEGRPPLFEPGLAESIAAGLAARTLVVSTDPAAVRHCRFVFLAHDTPVGEDDSSDLAPIWEAVEACVPHMDPGAILVISAQLPVGSAREIRQHLRQVNPTLEVVYSPENLRLGEALRCYLEPGHVVIGADSVEAGDAVEALFAPMKARAFRMNLPSAELVKHCINSFLAASVTLANQWADVAGAAGADFAEVVPALRADPRIGARAYLTPGIGFSGGTLGRDLRVLDEINRTALHGRAPIFGDIWRYNQRRVEVVGRRAEEILGALRGCRVALLGMTYKPGTSTLRRSLPLGVARDLLARGATVCAHDPKADWTEVTLPPQLQVAKTAYEAAEGTDLLVLLTEWPDYRELDFRRLAGTMRQRYVLDTKGFWKAQGDALRVAGLTLLDLVGAPGNGRA